jgi:hypothetical protein
MTHSDTLARIHQLLLSCPNLDLREPGGWTVREILGHLVDSASNNHQRLARYTPGENFIFPGYEQEECVRRAHYATFDFDSLLALWLNYNRLYLHIVAHIPPEHLNSPVTIGTAPTMTLGALIEDYFAHMQKHEQQINHLIKPE